VSNWRETVPEAVMVHALLCRHGGGIGVAAMCAGVGMGSATVIEVPAA
jgi:acetyl-CoA acyltransferase